MKLQNKRWSDEEFYQKRKEVLGRWPTGKEIDLDEAVEYANRLPNHKVFPKKLAKAKKEGNVLAEPGTGVAMVDSVIEHMKYVEKAGADAFLLHTDSYTRSARYDAAQNGLEQSIKAGRSMLNGLPIVNIGLKKLREINEVINIPIRIVGAPDQETELNAEMGLASGFTAIPSYTLHCVAQHCRDFPLEKRTQVQQYINRLAGYYTERGAPVELSIVGCINGWTPPSLNIATVVIDSLIAAEQGGKHQSVGLGLQMNITQDVAGLCATRELVAEYLKKFGYNDVVASSWIWSWMGDWPEDVSQAAGLVALCTSIGVLGGVNWLVVKSVEEAIGVTSPQGNAAGLRLAKQVIRILRHQTLVNDSDVKLEKEMIKKETRAILDRVFELGNGDVCVGQLKAVEEGVLDFPFSPYIPLKGKVLAARDLHGAIRYKHIGNLPFTKDIIEYNREKLAERERAEGRELDLNVIAEDLFVRSQPVTAAVE